VSAFWANWIAQKNGFHIPWIHAYMDDLICIPVILFPLMFLFRRWIYPSGYFVFPLSYIVTAWVLVSLMFEVYLPQKNPANTSDPLDMVLYAVGGVLFYAMQKPFARQSQTVLGKV
jgi:hypothetical protein